MPASTFHKPADGRDYALALFIAALIAVATAVIAGAVLRRDPDTVLVMATQKDCLRAFDTAACRRIVSDAFALHARTAPRFLSASTCELGFGENACRDFDDGTGGRFYAPSVAVILVSRERGDGDGGVLPLYFIGESKKAASAAAGRRVAYRGRAVGTLSDMKFGGADISRLVDLDGGPLTSAAARKLGMR